MMREGDWKCTCGYKNFAGRNNCRDCGKDKNNTNTNNSNTEEGDWKCLCGFSNFAKRNNCRECGKNRSPNSSNNNINSIIGNNNQQSKEGDWKCLCGFSNFAKRNNCRECGKNRSSNSSSRSNTNQQSKEGDWKCLCGFSNFAKRDNCRECGKNRSSNSSSNNTNNTSQMKMGDWICKCGFLNYARRTNCFECDSPASKDNKVALKEGDWICSCGYKNFARRTNCNDCKAPKDLSGSPSNTTSNKDRKSDLKFLIILDFEATCDEPNNPSPQEIIELPSVLVDIENKKIIGSVQHYVKPLFHPKLSKFCTELTGITQKQVDEAIPFPKVFESYKKWLEEKDLSYPHAKFVTCGDWDLRRALPQQLNASKLENEPFFQQWINIKNEFSILYNKRSSGMMQMLNILDIQHEGKHHSGLDDCKNIAKIAVKMLQDGWVPI